MSRQAIAHLRAADPVIARAIGRHGAYGLKPTKHGSHFGFVARSIIYQQLSTKAAATIHQRFCDLFEHGAPSPRALLDADDARLRSAGLSRQKIGYLRDLAMRVDAGEVRVEALGGASDDDVIEQLTHVKGVGRWTAQMFLMFRLGRLDVLPDADLGIQKAIQNQYRLRSLPKPERVRTIGAPWAPYRTVACWYLWRTLDDDGGAM